jgi:hypothetical protein
VKKIGYSREHACNGFVESGEPKNRFTVYPIIKTRALDATYIYESSGKVCSSMLCNIDVSDFSLLAGWVTETEA